MKRITIGPPPKGIEKMYPVSTSDGLSFYVEPRDFVAFEYGGEHIEGEVVGGNFNRLEIDGYKNTFMSEKIEKLRSASTVLDLEPTEPEPRYTSMQPAA